MRLSRSAGAADRPDQQPALHDADGRFLGCRGGVRQVTAERDMLAALRDGVRRLRSLVGAMRGIIVCHPSAGSGAHGRDEGGARIGGADATEIAGPVDARAQRRLVRGGRPR